MPLRVLAMSNECPMNCSSSQFGGEDVVDKASSVHNNDRKSAQISHEQGFRVSVGSANSVFSRRIPTRHVGERKFVTSPAIFRVRVQASKFVFEGLSTICSTPQVICQR